MYAYSLYDNSTTTMLTPCSSINVYNDKNGNVTMPRTYFEMVLKKIRWIDALRDRSIIKKIL